MKTFWAAYDKLLFYYKHQLANSYPDKQNIITFKVYIFFFWVAVNFIIKKYTLLDKK